MPATITFDGRTFILLGPLGVQKSKRGPRPDGHWALNSDNETYRESLVAYMKLKEVWTRRLNDGTRPTEEQSFMLMLSTLAHFAHEEAGDFRIVFAMPKEPPRVMRIYRRLKSVVLQETVVRFRPQKKRHLSVKGVDLPEVEVPPLRKSVA